MKTLTSKKKVRRRPHAKRIRSTGGCFGLTDELWALLEPLLPVHQNPHFLGGGRPRTPDRTCAEAIFFVLRTGCQWNALNATGLCASSTAHDRFQAWVEDGFFLRFWQAGLAEYDAFNGIDWEWMSMDGAMTKAPLGGEKNRAQPRGSRQKGTKRSLLDGGGACRSPSWWPGPTATISNWHTKPWPSLEVELPAAHPRQTCAWTRTMILREFGNCSRSSIHGATSARGAKKPKPKEKEAG